MVSEIWEWRSMWWSIAFLWAIAVVTPGPNLLAVLGAARRSRFDVVWLVAGVMTGTACWGLAGSFGLLVLFAAAPALFVAFKVAGGCYLLVLGVRSIANAAAARENQPVRSGQGRPLLMGLATSLSNPKSALFVASLVAATMPAGGVGVQAGVLTTALMVAISGTWYLGVGLLASSRVVGRVLARGRRLIDFVAGVAFTGFGARLLLATR